MGGGEPSHRLGVHADRLGRLGLGCQLQPERADLPFERSRGEQLGLPGTRCRYGHSFPLFPQGARTPAIPGAAFPQVRGSSGQGRGRTTDLPLFRIKDVGPGLAMLVSRPAQDPAAACGGPTCTNMYETGNETTNLASTLVVATLGRPSWTAHRRIQSPGSVRVVPAD